ncbi:MAG: PHP domain-containing protein [Acidobacteria bacterium]|nr:PHP domain-containing protein [Acidobacteriota bacterium]MCL5286402.1 PHP domain-containing protein [Acidobacteriota bacterium]
MKCDLHVHTVHSGMCTIPLFRHIVRESYTPPEELYEQLKRRGMDLVTITDHDSIEGAEALRRHADFFLSEEVTVQMPSGTRLHVGVYDITERQHIEIQRRRNDLPWLLAYLSEKRLLFSVNHPFSSLTGRREASDFVLLADFFPAVETRNGHMLRRANDCAEQLARFGSKAILGGSDAHALPSAGTAWTEVRGVRTKEEFLEGIVRGRGRVAGASGHFGKLTRDVYLIAAAAMRERKWLLPFAPLAAAIIPAWTLSNYVQELAFVWFWEQALDSAKDARTGGWRARTLPEEAA